MSIQNSITDTMGVFTEKLENAFGIVLVDYSCFIAFFSKPNKNSFFSIPPL